MKNIMTIAIKEFRGYISGSGFYFITGLFTTLMSFIYFMILKSFMERSNQMMAMMGKTDGANMHREIFVSHISTVNLILLFLIPFLTVRLLAEEKKLRTFDLLLTSPITATDIVLGKYFAVLAASWFLIFISFLYPAVTALFTHVQWGPLLAAYAGMMLLAAVYASIGLFASSLTDNMILAGFISIILSLGLWFLGSLQMVVEGPTATAIANHISVANHFGQMLQGSVQIVAIVFFLSLAFLNVFLTQRVVESARWR
jgi:ABC-2 type transport system permease protein